MEVSQNEGYLKPSKSWMTILLWNNNGDLGIPHDFGHSHMFEAHSQAWIKPPKICGLDPPKSCTRHVERMFTVGIDRTRSNWHCGFLIPWKICFNRWEIGAWRFRDGSRCPWPQQLLKPWRRAISQQFFEPKLHVTQLYDTANHCNPKQIGSLEFQDGNLRTWKVCGAKKFMNLGDSPNTKTSDLPVCFWLVLLNRAWTGWPLEQPISWSLWNGFPTVRDTEKHYDFRRNVIVRPLVWQGFELSVWEMVAAGQVGLPPKLQTGL